jgi:hypothetical protein
MENVFHPSIAAPQARKIHTSVFSKFFSWCKNQEKYRLGWLGAILTVHGCVLTPITLFAVILAGTNFVLYIAVLVSMAMAVVTNLAAMPTKFTIPVFFFSILIDIIVITLCIVAGFSYAATQI